MNEVAMNTNVQVFVCLYVFISLGYILSIQLSGYMVSKRVKSLSCVQLFATPWTVAHQAPPSMEFSRQEYWSGLPFPSPGDLPDPGIEPKSPALQADALPSEPLGNPRERIWKKINKF